MAITWAPNEKGVSHLRCKTANKFLNVREWVKMVWRKKDSPFPFFAKGNLDSKKIKLGFAF